MAKVFSGDARLARKSDAGPSTTRFCCLARHTEHDHAFILVALPAAFRIWVVTHPTPSALEPSPDTQQEQEPLYSSPRSAVKRVLSTNCCRQSSD
ncbi:MAG: hypothetical protein WBL81_03380 [Pseudolabrys sp.]